MTRDIDYREWKANARGVDINRNYAEGFRREGAKSPGYKMYAGKKPVSEPETKAQIFVVEKVKPDVVICYQDVYKRQEEPFVVATDSIEYKVYLMIWKKSLMNTDVYKRQVLISNNYFKQSGTTKLIFSPLLS